MPKSAKPLPILTDEQKAILEAHWFEDPDQLLRRLWPDRPELNRRTIEWKSCRAFLATIGKNAETKVDSAAGPSSAPPAPKLTTEQEEFIRVSYSDASGPVELARTLYHDERIMSNDPRVRMIVAFIRKIDPTYRREDEECADIDYQPPKTANHLVGRLNRYGVGARPDGKKIGDGGMTPQEQRQIEALLVNMRRSVFKVEADKFTKKIDRDVFEETFLATCWDKPDLTAEHALQFIQLASLFAQRNATDRMMRTLDDRFMLSLEDPTKRLGKTEVDALKETKAAAAEHLKQINGLIKTLTGERSKLISERVAGAASMHPLVQAWKARETRQRQLDLAKKYNEELKAEVGRLAGMDALKCEIWGINPNTIVQ